MKRSIVLHYHEINLKGNNRGWFENRLHQHVHKVLHGLEHEGIRKFGGRMIVSLPPDSNVEEYQRRLRRVFGIANFAAAWEVHADLDSIRGTVAALAGAGAFRSFKIDSRRGTKEFPLNSQQLNQELGRFVQELTGAEVRLEDPELTLWVEIVGGRAFLYTEKVEGAGGLPTGTGGKVVSLLSGGIDSPVAAYRLLRRGCQVLYVHFHSFPHSTAESQEKVRRILQILAGYQLDARLFLVPFAELQREIVAYAPPPLRVVLYRRYMMRIAEAIATEEKAAALVTGDNLGQVASQTLENLRTVSDAVRLPIFRPLIGDDKEDIMNAARKIGTYETSILPDQDCCTMFIPRHPETMSSIEAVNKAEGALDSGRLVASALAGVTRETIHADYQDYQPQVDRRTERV
jgi:thiamine biosynthesis protein ThiI